MPLFNNNNNNLKKLTKKTPQKNDVYHYDFCFLLKFRTSPHLYYIALPEVRGSNTKEDVKIVKLELEGLLYEKILSKKKNHTL